jgi:exodeoxyribonuclease-5
VGVTESPVKAVELSEEQATAFGRVVNRVRGGELQTVLGGSAGTGKTTLIRELVSSLKGLTQVAAFTGKAVDVICRLGVPALTIHSLIYTPDKDKKGDLIFRLKPDDMLPKCDCLIIDEASMVPEDIYNDLVEHLDMPIVFVGDHCQLPPVKGRFNIMSEPDIRLETPHRFAGRIAKFANYVRQGSPPEQFTTDEQLIFLPEGREDETVVLISRWVLMNRDPVENLPDYQILAATNNERAGFNGRVRYLLGRTGAPVKGDRIIFLLSNGRIRNGQMAELISWEEQGKVIRATAKLESGKEYSFEARPCFGRGLPKDPDRMPAVAYMDYGYCITTHKAQGSEFDRVVTWDVQGYMREKLMEKNELHRWQYTAATRAKKELVWVY